MTAADQYVRQKRRAAIAVVLSLGALALIAAAIYPPWRMSLHRHDRPLVSTPAGYDWLSAHPHSPNRMPIQDLFAGVQYSVDYGHLLVEWLIIAAATGAGLALLVLWNFLRYRAQRERWLEEARMRIELERKGAK
jgi:hypothetical protein